MREITGQIVERHGFLLTPDDWTHSSYYIHSRHYRREERAPTNLVTKVFGRNAREVVQHISTGTELDEGRVQQNVHLPQAEQAQ